MASQKIIYAQRGLFNCGKLDLGLFYPAEAIQSINAEKQGLLDNSNSHLDSRKINNHRTTCTCGSSPGIPFDMD